MRIQEKNKILHTFLGPAENETIVEPDSTTPAISQDFPEFTTSGLGLTENSN